MRIVPGDVFQVMVRRGDGDTTRSQPLEGHRMTILGIDGEVVRYRRAGGEPGETTLPILTAAIRRGDFTRVNPGDG